MRNVKGETNRRALTFFTPNSFVLFPINVGADSSARFWGMLKKSKLCESVAPTLDSII